MKKSDTMCLMVRILYKFNTLEAFERAVRTIECNWGDKVIRGQEWLQMVAQSSDIVVRSMALAVLKVGADPEQ